MSDDLVQRLIDHGNQVDDATEDLLVEAADEIEALQAFYKRSYEIRVELTGDKKRLMAELNRLRAENKSLKDAIENDGFVHGMAEIERLRADLTSANEVIAAQADEIYDLEWPR